MRMRQFSRVVVGQQGGVLVEGRLGHSLQVMLLTGRANRQALSRKASLIEDRGGRGLWVCRNHLRERGWTQ